MGARVGLWVAVAAIALGCGRAAMGPPPSTVALWPELGGDGARSGIQGEVGIDPPLYLIWETRIGRGPVRDACLAGPGLVVASPDQSVRYLDLRNGGGFWKHKLKGAPATAPVVAEDRVIIGHDLPRPGLIALSIESGETLWWRQDLLPQGVPVIRDTLVYVVDRREGLSAVSLEDGTTAWSVELDAVWTGPLAESDGRLILTGGAGEVTALSTEDGSELWRATLSSETRAGATVVGDEIIIPGGRGEVVSLDAATGEPRWTRSLGTRLWAPAVVVDDEIYLTGSAGRLHVLDRSTGEPLWSVALAGGSRSRPVVVGDTVVITTLTATCQLISRSRQRVIHTVDLRRSVSTAPLVAGDRLVTIDDEGNVHAYESS